MIVIGRNGIGKFIFCEKIVKGIGVRALVVIYNGMFKIWCFYLEVDIIYKKKMIFLKGIWQVIVGWYEEGCNKNWVFEYIYCNYCDGMIIWDDCCGYINSVVDDNKYFWQLLLDFWYWMLDIIFVVYFFVDVLFWVWGFIFIVWVGVMDVLVNKSQVCIFSVDCIIEMQEEVN